jgi:hypothetical protein
MIEFTNLRQIESFRDLQMPFPYDVYQNISFQLITLMNKNTSEEIYWYEYNCV